MCTIIDPLLFKCLWKNKLCEEKKLLQNLMQRVGLCALHFQTIDHILINFIYWLKSAILNIILRDTPPSSSSTYHVHVHQLPAHHVALSRLVSPDLLDPDERVVKLWIYGLQVFESQRFVQDTLVEGQGETCVDEFTMEQGLERKCRAVR